MATNPKATTTIQDTASAAVGGLDVICVAAPVATNPDIRPRLFGSATAIYEQHGYSEGLEYSDAHARLTGKGILFIGLPIAAAGVISRVDQTGNTGSSVVSVVAGVAGVLHEHDGVVLVDEGGIIGTDQIKLSVSLDGGRVKKNFRLGTANTLALPYVGATLNFGAGTLVAGDVVLTWHGSGPRADSSGWSAARTALANQTQLFRSMMIIGDLQDHIEALAICNMVNAYETQNERFVYARVSVKDFLPQAAMSRQVVRMTGAPSLTFAEVGGTGDTITRSAGSWITDGFAVGDIITVTGSVSNNVTGPIAALSATVITLGTTDLAAEVAASCTVTASPGLTFAEVGATGDTITRSRGSWVDDGFRAGDVVTVAGTASNNVAGAITGATATVLTFGSTDLAAEVISSASVTITAGQTKAEWMADLDAEHETITNQFRIDMAAGRGRVLSDFSGWFYRRPASWFASWREYQHDLHIPTWQKALGPVDADLYDDEGNLVEWNDHVDGNAGSAARFTTLRTWPNDGKSAFIAQSLTRGDEGSLTSKTHNMAVINLAQTVTQLNTENAAIGQSLILNDDGTAQPASLRTIANRVNKAERANLLQDLQKEGPRASKATWTPDADVVFNVPEPVMTGVLDLNLNGTVHSVRTAVRLRSG